MTLPLTGYRSPAGVTRRHDHSEVADNIAPLPEQFEPPESANFDLIDVSHLQGFRDAITRTQGPSGFRS